jgi:hypothetical protein
MCAASVTTCVHVDDNSVERTVIEIDHVIAILVVL